jgi:hypothetical protein
VRAATVTAFSGATITSARWTTPPNVAAIVTGSGAATVFAVSVTVADVALR